MGAVAAGERGEQSMPAERQRQQAAGGGGGRRRRRSPVSAAAVGVTAVDDDGLLHFAGMLSPSPLSPPRSVRLP